MEMGILGGLLLATICVGAAVVLVQFTDWVRAPNTRLSNDAAPNPFDPNTAVFLYRNGILKDANTSARLLLSNCDGDHSDWRALAKVLTPRFSGFPEMQGGVSSDKTQSFLPSDEESEDLVFLEQWEDMARVTVQTQTPKPHQNDPVHTVKKIHDTVAGAPYPVWKSDPSGKVLWANAAYLKLANDTGLNPHEGNLPKVFDQSVLVAEQSPTRTAVSDGSRSRNYWFDVTTISAGQSLTHYASDANAIVNAEIAQRNFVQTLTKTFAQLSIGLAIFDRNRQLALFNPALIDLTSLPADFLSSRPNLQTFFDRMRENRMMPEPRNYASWREQIAELVVAASDDRFMETWTLPSGVTYRVIGRPHPDGAIAFLFEDISAEVSLTRRFRADLELGQSMIDSLKHAVAVFSPTGKLQFCNLAYRNLWNCEPDTGLAEHSFKDAMKHWRQNTEKTDDWERLRHHILDLNPRPGWSCNLVLQTGEEMEMQVVSLTGGYTSIVFDRRSYRAALPDPSEVATV